MKYRLFWLAGLICPLLPPRLGYWLFARFGDMFFLVGGKGQTTYWENLRRVLGRDATSEQMQTIGRRAFQNLLKNYYDLWRGPRLTRQGLESQLAELHGFAYVEDALNQGKGLIIGSAHFGAFDIVIHLAAIYLKAHVVMPGERIKPEKLFQYVRSMRASQGIEVIPLDAAPRALIKALRAGQIAGLAFDRDIMKTGPFVSFFGEPAQLPYGAVQLALKFNTPVLVGFVIRRPDNRCAVYIEPPLEFVRTGDLSRDIREGVQKLACLMEKYIRQYPDQWLMFQKIWD